MLPLGKTGIRVSPLGLGAWGIGSKSYGPVEESQAEATIEKYLAEGGNFIDTACGYNKSEEIIGNYLRKTGQRDQVVIASKIAPTDPAQVRELLETSLRLLQTDYIDLLYMHSPPENAEEIERTLDLYETLRAEGKIRAIGASIKGPSVTADTVALCRKYLATGRFDAFQIIFSIFRQSHRQIFDEAATANVSLIARTVLESGFLTAKYAPGHRFDEEDHRSRWSDEKIDVLLTEARQLEESHVKPPFTSLSEVAIRYVLDHQQVPGFTSVLVGAKSPAQVAANFQATHRPPLSPEIHEELQAAFGGRGEIANIS